MKKREETKKVEKVIPVEQSVNEKGKALAIKEESKRDVSPDKKGAKGK